MKNQKKKETKKKDRFKYSGSYPEETYELGTEKNLYLDKSVKLLKEYIKEYVRSDSG